MEKITTVRQANPSVLENINMEKEKYNIDV